MAVIEESQWEVGGSGRWGAVGGAGLGFPGQWEVGGSGRSRALVGAGLGFPGLLWGGFNRRGYVGQGLNMDNHLSTVPQYSVSQYSITVQCITVQYYSTVYHSTVL